MIPVIFYPGWNESTYEYLSRISWQTPYSSAQWGSICGTDKPSEARFAICQDSQISIKRAIADGFSEAQIIYIKREADSALPHLQNKNILSYQGSNVIIPSVWWIRIPFNDLVSLKNLQFKVRNLSAIVSSTSTLEGHRNRLAFIRRFAEFSELDVFGRGHNPDSFSGKYIGPLNQNGRCKYAGLERYRYSIAIENVSENGYITEKFNDCILSWAKPLYFGAPNASIYFPPNSFHQIQNLSAYSSFDKCILQSLELPSPEVISSIRQARELILFRFNLWNIAERLVREIL